MRQEGTTAVVALAATFSVSALKFLAMMEVWFARQQHFRCRFIYLHHEHPCRTYGAETHNMCVHQAFDLNGGDGNVSTVVESVRCKIVFLRKVLVSSSVPCSVYPLKRLPSTVE